MNTTPFKKCIAFTLMSASALFLIPNPAFSAARSAAYARVVSEDDQDKKDRDANKDRGKKEPKSVYREDKKDDRPKNDQKGKKPNR